MKKHKLPDGRIVKIRRFIKVPQPVRGPSMSHGVTDLLRLLDKGEMAEIPSVDGVTDNPVRLINGVVRMYQNKYGGKFVIRSLGEERVGVYRIG